MSLTLNIVLAKKMLRELQEEDEEKEEEEEKENWGSLSLVKTNPDVEKVSLARFFIFSSGAVLVVYSGKFSQSAKPRG